METKEKGFEFGITRVQDIGFFADETVNAIVGHIKLGYGMNMSWNIKDNWIEFVVKCEFKDSVSNKSFLTGNTLTRFSINNISQYIAEDGKAKFPPHSLASIFGIAFSHMRANLAKNAAGTPFNWVIVPAVDPLQVLTEILALTAEDLKSKKEKDLTNV